MTAPSFAMRLGLTNSVASPSTTRSIVVRFGARRRERLLMSSWCFSASDSAATAWMPPRRRSFAKVMDVGLHDGGIDTQRLAILRPEGNRRLHQQLIDGHERLRRQPHERPLERIVLGHRLAVEFRECAQRVCKRARRQSV